MLSLFVTARLQMLHSFKLHVSKCLGAGTASRLDELFYPS